IEGTIGSLEVAGDNIIAYAVNAVITNANVSGENSKIVTEENTVVEEEEKKPSQGGGGGPSTPAIAVSAISVKGTGDVDKITTDGGQLQMLATVEPDNASNKTVTWSVDKPGIAAISNSGLLTAKANGAVEVTAIAKDGSGVEGTASINISNQILVDKSELLEVISSARMLSEFVKVSTDGSNVGKCEFWVSSTAIKNTYEMAIEDAQTVANKANASQAEIKQAKIDLETAMDVFYKALKPGTKEVAISKITEITITEVIPPHHGEKANFDYTIPSNANYIKIDRGEWYDLSKPNNPRLMEETDTFLSGEEYEFRATLVAKPCYEFDFLNPSATINGENASEIKKANDDGFIEITYEFTATGPEIHYVNFHSDNWYDQVIVEDGKTISLPEPPTKEGYIFGGWYTGKGGTGTQFTESTPVTGELTTLYAKWTLITYTVTFDSDGGTEVAAITEVKPNTSVTLPTPPTKEGFDFGGWYTAKYGEGKVFTESTPVTGDITVYAKWTGENILVTSITVTGEDKATTITTDGGTLQMIAKVEPATASDQKVYWSIKESKIATISYDGILTAVANGTVTVTAEAVDGSGIIGSVDITISGQPKYSLTMVVEGEGTVSPTDSDYQYERGSIVDIEATPAAGWYFEKWVGDVKESNKAKTTITMSEAKTVKAVFKEGENPDFAGGYGTLESPYKVANPEHLNNVRNYLDAHFIQTADIDLENFDFEVIGNYYFSKSFDGNYDGDGKEIKNLEITKYVSYYGLFAYNKGIIKNVNLRDCDVKGKDHTGSLVGQNSGEIINCSATGNVTGTFIVGGLVASNQGKISGSYATCQVTSRENPSRAGGLVGYNSGEISKSYAMGEVFGKKNNIGGLVGENHGTISESYATGNVTVEGDSNYGFGGLVGENNGTISKSYATGKVAGGYSRTGGLVGDNGGKIEESYATGQVTGQRELGGLVGRNSGEISKSYWDKESSGQNKSSGSDENFGKTTAEMQTQATYVGWDFTSTWSINENSYPILKWQVSNP
ncbi:MAG: InlB B-repeat-containing protein, partial [Gudongella sp.]|nr:InlB B-repeat-containing protein [Gudongella sp.]